ncbi:MAG: RecQ family zinc-binding domain-containing protein, partial [Gemmatimonadales bacterium]|nr:RecQ family zinc-binding domain-containing protein [Gemmatimonadales bacterium]
PDWGPVRHRRQRAEARIAAMESYAAGRGCRRRSLIGYFGERIPHCAGCDRCESQGSRSSLLSFWRRATP